jgi:hypothetical protein
LKKVHGHELSWALGAAYHILQNGVWSNVAENANMLPCEIWNIPKIECIVVIMNCHVRLMVFV